MLQYLRNSLGLNEQWGSPLAHYHEPLKAMFRVYRVQGSERIMCDSIKIINSDTCATLSYMSSSNIYDT